MILLERLRSVEPILHTPDGTWSGLDLGDAVAGAIAFLDDRAVRRGEVVPALVTTSAASIALAGAGALTGRPLAPLGTGLTAVELARVLAGMDASVLVAEPPYLELASRVGRDLGLAVASLAVHRGSAGDIEADLDPTGPALVLHTSGTTGLPKEVVVHKVGLAARVAVFEEILGLGPGDVYCTASRFFHTAGVGMIFVALEAGASVVPLPAFSVETWQAATQRHAVTQALLVPTMIELLLDAGALEGSDVRVLQYGAAPIHPDTLGRVLHTLPTCDVVQVFGQTEGSPITYLSAAEHRRAAVRSPEVLASVGCPAPGLDLRVETPDADGVGEVAARAAWLFAPDADGWLRTGDMGRVDASGFLHLAGRHGDRIIRGGENIYPLEIERVLEQHPAIVEAAVVGVPDRTWGEVLKGVVVSSVADRPSDEELTAWCREHLARFKVPDRWEWRDELVRNAVGKLLRPAMR